jgi:hypothetical protein
MFLACSKNLVTTCFCRNTPQTGKSEYHQKKKLKKVFCITRRWPIPAKTICNQILLHVEQEKGSFREQIGLILKEETSKMLP